MLVCFIILDTRDSSCDPRKDEEQPHRVSLAGFLLFVFLKNSYRIESRKLCLPSPLSLSFSFFLSSALFLCKKSHHSHKLARLERRISTALENNSARCKRKEERKRRNDRIKGKSDAWKYRWPDLPLFLVSLHGDQTKQPRYVYVRVCLLGIS